MWDGISGTKQLIVASTGGHLAQAVRWAERLSLSPESLFATFDSQQSQSLLQSRPHIFIPYMAPRQFGTLLPTIRQLRRAAQSEFFDGVFSTGAGVALAACVAAKTTGLSMTFMESVSRFDGPSVTGRVLQHVPGIERLCQHSSWAGGSWRYAGTLLEDFRPCDRLSSPESVQNVFVTLGTIQPYRFDALVDAVESCLTAGQSAIWQTGATDRRDMAGSVAYMSTSEFERMVLNADVVITHAGVGTLLRMLELGVRPIVVPRRRDRGEHVDDHQQQVARALGERDLIIYREVADLCPDDLLAASRSGVTFVPRG